MSANLLERVTPGPWRSMRAVDWMPDAKRIGIQGLRVVDEAGAVVMEAFPRPWPVHVNDANAELIALAPDHALWGAAVTAGRAKWQPKARRVALLSVLPFRPDGSDPEDYAEQAKGWTPEILRAFPTTLDAAGCPALTPELREALRAALGIEAAR